MTPQEVADVKLKWMGEAHIMEFNSDHRGLLLRILKDNLDKENWDLRKYTSQESDTVLFRYKDDLDKILRIILSK